MSARVVPLYDRDRYVMDAPEEAQRLMDKVDPSAWTEKYFAPYLHDAARILSVGCGPGHFLEAYARYRPSAEIVGLDASPARIADARRRNEAFPNVRAAIGDVHDMPLASGRFDFVEARFLLEYLKNPLAAIDEMVRVTRPGGHVCLQDLDGHLAWHYPEDERIAAVHQAMALLKDTGFDAFVGRKLFALARQAGLTEIAVRVDTYDLIAGGIDKFHLDLWRRKLAIAEPAIAKLCGSAARARGMTDAYLDYLRDDTTLSYSTLFTVIGRKPLP